MTNSIMKSKKEEIIQLLKDKDAEGVQLLSNEYSNYLLDFIKRWIKQEKIATMVLENTFCKIKKEIDKFDRSSEIFLRWIARLALEESIHQLKGTFTKCADAETRVSKLAVLV